MKDLIAKLEAAPEGSRELDAEIAVALFPLLKTYTPDSDKGPGHWVTDRPEGETKVYAQDYTTSLDAELRARQAMGDS